jgi:hypothetical protein
MWRLLFFLFVSIIMEMEEGRGEPRLCVVVHGKDF